MRKLLLAVFVLSTLLAVIGCNHNKDHNDSTGQGEKQDRLDATSGKMPEHH